VITSNEIGLVSYQIMLQDGAVSMNINWCKIFCWKWPSA